MKRIICPSDGNVVDIRELVVMAAHEHAVPKLRDALSTRGVCRILKTEPFQGGFGALVRPRQSISMRESWPRPCRAAMKDLDGLNWRSRSLGPDDRTNA